MTTDYALPRETWVGPQGDVRACFELSDCDAPILRGIKSADRAQAWRDADRLNRFIVPFRIDHEPQPVEDKPDLFSLAGVKV